MCGSGRYKDYGAQLGLFVGPTHCRRLAQLPGRTPPPAPGQAVANRRVGVGGEITTAQEDDIWVVRSSSYHQWLVSQFVSLSVSLLVSLVPTKQVKATF